MHPEVDPAAADRERKQSAADHDGDADPRSIRDERRDDGHTAVEGHTLTGVAGGKGKSVRLDQPVSERRTGALDDQFSQLTSSQVPAVAPTIRTASARRWARTRTKDTPTTARRTTRTSAIPVTIRITDVKGSLRCTRTQSVTAESKPTIRSCSARLSCSSKKASADTEAMPRETTSGTSKARVPRPVGRSGLASVMDSAYESVGGRLVGLERQRRSGVQRRVRRLVGGGCAATAGAIPDGSACRRVNEFDGGGIVEDRCRSRLFPGTTKPPPWRGLRVGALGGT